MFPVTACCRGGSLGGVLAPAPDTTAPTIVSATIDSTGFTLTVVFTEAVTTAGDHGLSLTSTNPAAIDLTYGSGDGTDTLIFDISRPVYLAEILTLSGTGSDIIDAAENALENFSGTSVTNGSTEPGIFLISVASSNHSSGKNGATSSEFNATGADLIVVVSGYFGGGSGYGVGDSKSNAYTPLTALASPDDNPTGRIHYCLGGTVGTGQTVTISGTNVFVGFQVAAFGGVGSYFDELVQTGTTPGEITLPDGLSLIICGFVESGTTAPSAIDSDFEIAGADAGVSSQSYSTGLAYRIDSDLGSVTPDWTGSGGDGRALAAVFQPAS